MPAKYRTNSFVNLSSNSEIVKHAFVIIKSCFSVKLMEFLIFTSNWFTLWKLRQFALTVFWRQSNIYQTSYKRVDFTNFFGEREKFRQINYLVISLVEQLLSRNFCEKSVRENICIFHTCTLFWLLTNFSVKSKQNLANICIKSLVGWEKLKLTFLKNIPWNHIYLHIMRVPSLEKREKYQMETNSWIYCNKKSFVFTEFLQKVRFTVWKTERFTLFGKRSVNVKNLQTMKLEWNHLQINSTNFGQ